MKLFTSQQLKEADQATIINQNISALDLMERAATMAFKEIEELLKGQKVMVKIFCGVGNNGGDGLVVARLLLQSGYAVKVYVVNYSDKRSAEFLVNYDRIKGITNDWPILLTPTSDLPDLSENDLIIDAIFGIGLNRALQSWVVELVRHINTCDAFVLSIDMPTGLFTDQVPSNTKEVIKADATLTFQIPKLVFFLPETANFVGGFKVLDIGLDQQYLQETLTEIEWVDQQVAFSFYKPREKFSHKGTYGHSLIVGGAYGKMGSVVLTATAAFRIGAGKVTTLIPKCGYAILQTTLPEAMVITSKTLNFLAVTEIDFEPETICFGIGAGKHLETVQGFEEILKKAKSPMVIDADGINILSETPHLLKNIPEKSVLTPHPKELKRLIGEWKDDFDKLRKARTFAQTHQIILVIKGAFTLTLVENKTYINSTGNPGMATAGSGDVLAGVITGLLSQGYAPDRAAILGVYIHGAAGDIAAQKLGVNAMIASDISNNMGSALKKLLQRAPDE